MGYNQALALVTPQQLRLSQAVRQQWHAFQVWYEQEHETKEKNRRQRSDELNQEMERSRRAAPGMFPSLKKQYETKAKQVNRQLDEDLVSRARVQWNQRLQNAALLAEDWIDMTPEEIAAIEEVLGDVDDREEPQPIAHAPQPTPIYTQLPAIASTSQLMLPSSTPATPYVFVSAKAFHDDDEEEDDASSFAAMLAVQMGTSGEEIPSLAQPKSDSGYKSWTAEVGLPTARAPPVPVQHSFSQRNAPEQKAGPLHPLPQEDPREYQPSIVPKNPHVDHARKRSASQVGLDTTEQLSRALPQPEPHHERRTIEAKPSTSEASQAESRQLVKALKPKMPTPYIGPILFDPKENQQHEQAQFEMFKMEIRDQKIREFHHEAAEADSKLVRHMVNSSLDGEIKCQLVKEHEQRMLELRELKDIERKQIVDAEREKRRAEIKRRKALDGADAQASHGLASSPAIQVETLPESRPTGYPRRLSTNDTLERVGPITNKNAVNQPSRPVWNQGRTPSNASQHLTDPIRDGDMLKPVAGSNLVGKNRKKAVTQDENIWMPGGFDSRALEESLDLQPVQPTKRPSDFFWVPKYVDLPVKPVDEEQPTWGRPRRGLAQDNFARPKGTEDVQIGSETQERPLWGRLNRSASQKPESLPITPSASIQVEEPRPVWGQPYRSVSQKPETTLPNMPSASAQVEEPRPVWGQPYRGAPQKPEAAFPMTPSASIQAEQQPIWGQPYRAASQKPAAAIPITPSASTQAGESRPIWGQPYLAASEKPEATFPMTPSVSIQADEQQPIWGQPYRGTSQKPSAAYPITPSASNHAEDPLATFQKGQAELHARAQAISMKRKADHSPPTKASKPMNAPPNAPPPTSSYAPIRKVAEAKPLKGILKNSGHGRNAVTVEEVSDDEGELEYDRPSDPRIIMEPRPTMPQSAFTPIFDYSVGSEDKHASTEKLGSSPPTVGSIWRPQDNSAMDDHEGVQAWDFSAGGTAAPDFSWTTGGETALDPSVDDENLFSLMQQFVQDPHADDIPISKALKSSNVTNAPPPATKLPSAEKPVINPIVDNRGKGKKKRKGKGKVQESNAGQEVDEEQEEGGWYSMQAKARSKPASAV